MRSDQGTEAGVVAPETIDAGQVRLRRPRLSDAPAIFEYASDPELAHYADWPLCADIAPLVDSLNARAARWDAGEEFLWVMTLPTADCAIGSVGCRFIQHSADLGYVVNRSYWGRGLATSATRAIVEWALSAPSIWRVWATCDVENLASARVLEKVGLSREGILRRYAVRPLISHEPRDAFLYSRVR